MTISYTPRNLINKIIENNYSYTHSYAKKITGTNSEVEKLQDKADTFQKSVKKLKRYSPGGISKDMLENQVEDLVKSYNALKSSSEKITDEDIQKQITKLEKLFSDNESGLKKIGIEKNNGKYTFDSDTFADASAKNINSILVGNDSLIGKADKIMRKIEESADDAKYNVVEQKVSRTIQYQETDMKLAANMTLAGQATSAMNACNSLVQSDSLPDNQVQQVQQSLKTYLTYFAQSVYRTDSTYESADIARLNQLCIDHQEKLAKLGLHFDSEQKNMVFDDTVDMSTNDFKTAYNELFGENSIFGNTISDCCKNIFNDIIQPGKIGVSIVDEQA